MGESTIGLVLLLLVVAAIIAVTVLVARSESSKVSDRILDALHGVPLFRLLQKRRIDPLAYVQAIDTLRMRQQIATCRACISTQQCEAVLGDPAAGADDLSFCPNEAAILHAKDLTGSSNASR